ncbi:MAG: IPT/TIG domain-containing protein [Flavisolibacter sp.]
MKQFQNACLALSGFLLISLAISCKKDAGSAPPVIPSPTITSFTPTSANPGATITITGTNLTGATAVSFGGTAASSFTVTNATTITAVVGNGASGEVKVTTPGGAASLAGFVLTQPPIDGYNNSNEVGAINLKAHWTFDSTAAESISTAVPTTSINATYTTGKIGKALSLAKGYLIYPTLNNLNKADSLANFTISMWVNMPSNNKAEFPATGGQLVSLFQLNGNDFQDIWGLISLLSNSNYNYGNDTLGLAGTTVHVNGSGTHLAQFELAPRTTASENFQGANKWSLITETYDGPSHTISFYGNGVLLGTRVTGNVVSPETLAMLTPNRVSFGTFEFYDDFTTGQWGHPPLAADRPWASHGITASLDDARVFNKALTANEILALYHLGQAGR